MKKAILVVLVLAAGGAAWWAVRNDTLRPDATAQTGVSVVFSSRLSSETELLVRNDKGAVAKQIALAKGGDRYNVSLKPGVYSVSVSSPSHAFPPPPTSTVTVSDKNLTTLQMDLGSPE